MADKSDREVIMDQNLKKEMEKFAVKIRMGVVDEITTLGFGHIGGSLSVCDALAVTVALPPAAVKPLPIDTLAV